MSDTKPTTNLQEIVANYKSVRAIIAAHPITSVIASVLVGFVLGLLIG